MFKKLIGIGIIAAVGMVAGITDPALAQDKGLQETQDKGLRDKGLVDRDPLRYSDEVKGMKEVIERPKPLVE